MAGIYIHIPFCKQACHYCDFHFSTSMKYRDQLLAALKKEITLQKGWLQGETIETVYLGGGTPSLLQGAEINSLFDTINTLHAVAADAEITLEANPDDLDNEKIKQLRQTPVNRLSIGIQSFFDDDLQWMNRAHRAAEAEASVKRAQDAGFENITADLIYGYPLLTDAKWKSNISTMLALDVPHISAYGITVEPRTALAAFISKKKQPPVNEQQSAEQFTLLMDTLQAQGFEHYEISNFCKPGQYSKHNSAYWRGAKYLGIGPSAHSYNYETRRWNIANNALYTEAIEKGNIPAEQEVLTETDRLNEYIMTSLRTMWGLHLDRLNTIAQGAAAQIETLTAPFINKGWLTQTNGVLYLTPTGKLYADHIASELFF